VAQECLPTKHEALSSILVLPKKEGRKERGRKEEGMKEGRNGGRKERGRKERGRKEFHVTVPMVKGRGEKSQMSRREVMPQAVKYFKNSKFLVLNLSSLHFFNRISKTFKKMLYL
jgi:hypothetical protein